MIIMSSERIKLSLHRWLVLASFLWNSFAASFRLPLPLHNTLHAPSPRPAISTLLKWLFHRTKIRSRTALSCLKFPVVAPRDEAPVGAPRGGAKGGGFVGGNSNAANAQIVAAPHSHDQYSQLGEEAEDYMVNMGRRNLNHVFCLDCGVQQPQAQRDDWLNCPGVCSECQLLPINPVRYRSDVSKGWL